MRHPVLLRYGQQRLVPLQLTVGWQLVLGVAVDHKGERAARREGGEVEITGWLPVIHDPVMVKGIGYQAGKRYVVKLCAHTIGCALVIRRVCHVVGVGCILNRYGGCNIRLHVDDRAGCVVPVRYGPQRSAGDGDETVM